MIVSFGFLVVFTHRIAMSIQTQNVVSRIGRELHGVVHEPVEEERRIPFRAMTPDAEAEREALLARFAGEGGVLRTARTGFVQEVDTLELVAAARVRWLELDEEARLVDACAKSENRELHDIVTIALETGLRRGELMALTWERVHLSRGVLRLERTKSGRRREVPLREAVYRILAARPVPRQGRISRGAFPRAAWEHALTETGIEGLTFHDTRHHFASWFVMRRGKLQALQEILGHRSPAMTQRYAHPSADYLRREMLASERRAFLEPNAGTEHLARDERALEVLDSSGERRGSSVAEQLIRNQ